MDNNNNNYNGYNGYSYPPANRMSNGRFAALLVCILVLSCSILALGFMVVATRGNEAPAETAVTSRTQDIGSGVIYQSVSSKDTQIISENDAIINVAANAKDSVVEITTETAVTNAFFGQYIQGGAGSGVIITEDGYIVTNNHVIDGATTITVRTTDGMEYAAEVIGADDDADIAVIKIKADVKLVSATFGDSEKLVVGEKVVAIGNPLGKLGGTVTDGIVSALDREIEIDKQKKTFLQTNAAINPGNSGGGLFNLNGELIAIVNAKSSGSSIEGLGFAIPINHVKDTINQLIEYGYVKGKVKIGITYADITSTNDYWNYRTTEIGKYIDDYGVYVHTSEQENLKPGDRFVAVDGEAVSVGADVKSAIKGHAVGDEIEITVARSGKIMTVKVNLLEDIPVKENNSDKNK